MEIGLRVVRGPDWKWGEQDGGEGNIGTVIEIGKTDCKTSPAKTVVVLWDWGFRSNYRVGYDNAYDLRIYDNAPIGISHSNILCCGCKVQGFSGIRFKCSQCHDYDLCLHCYMSGYHDTAHIFQMFQTGYCAGIEVPAREGSRYLPVKGIFVGAKVVRGHDWDWANQDGGKGKTGHVLDIRGWDKESNRSVANVIWSTGISNVYRLGHKGKCDLKCIHPAAGGTYYVDHLPVLGRDIELLPEYVGGGVKSIDTFHSGDKVKVMLDESTLKELQAGHGGWNPRMMQYIGEIGMVHRVTDRGDIRVQYEGCNNRWTFHPKALTKVNKYSIGDSVCITSDVARMKQLQIGHGEWLDIMASDAGKIGNIMKVYSDGDVRVMVDDNTWTLNPLCVERVPDTPNAEMENNLSRNSNLENITSLPNSNSNINQAENEELFKDYLLKEASKGNIDILTRYFEKHPEEINFKSSGKTCLHVACHEGRLDIIQYLLSVGASVELTDEDGDMALHYAAYGNQPAVLDELLKKTSVNINTVDKRLCSALHIAVNKEFINCVKVLLQHKANVNLQDMYGDTVLHDAIGKENTELVNMLCTQPSLSYSIVNNNGFNTLHHSALRGNHRVMQTLLQHAAFFVNIKKDDGFAPLHLACLNGHCEVVKTIVIKGNADLELRNDRGQTPLLLTAYQGHCAILEFLVKRGADVNAQDDDGDTALHYIFQKKNYRIIGRIIEPKTPVLFAIYLKLISKYPEIENPEVLAVGCFFKQYGFLLTAINKKGLTVQSIISNDIVFDVLKNWSVNPSLPDISSVKIQEDEKYAFNEDSSYTKPVPAECIICSELSDNHVIFEPCGHQIACEDCSSRMKKCVKCTCVITKRITHDSRIIPCRSRQSSAERLRYLETKIAEIEEAHSCPICMEKRKTVIFLCGHGACSRCSSTLKLCHMCRTSITKKINIY